MKDAIPCIVRCVHPPRNGRVALAFNEEGSDKVFRMTIPEDQAAILSEMLKNEPLAKSHIQERPYENIGPIQQQEALAESYHLRAENLTEGHPDKDLQRERLLAKAERCELKVRDLSHASAI